MRRCSINRRSMLVGLVAPAFANAAIAQDTPQVNTLSIAGSSTSLLGAGNPQTQHWIMTVSDGGQILRARQGVELHIHVVNNVSEDIWLHFFGVRGPSEQMTIFVPAGGSADAQFVPPDAGTFWIGPLLQASRQREFGATCMLVVEESAPQILQELALVFDDWAIDDDGKLQDDFGNLGKAAGEGRLGNWFTVNGALKPRYKLDAEKPVRLRLLNVANTRSFNILFKGADGIVLARDGQPQTPQPLGLAALNLAPGQSADILLIEAQAEVVLAIDLFEDVVEAAFVDASGYGRKTMPANFALPSNPVAQWDDALSKRSVELAIEGGLKGGLTQARVGKDVLDLRAMLEQGLVWSIGGIAGLGSPPLFTANLGEQLKLLFDNRTAFEQVLHIHGHVWSVQDPALSPNVAWSDSLVVPAESKAFAWLVANVPGTWAIQSLHAERCDAGLIGAFTVADMP